jgi:hypothetical protein
MKATCPGPGRSDECSEYLCKRSGCFGALPPRRDPPRDILPDVVTIAAAVLGVIDGK